MFKAGEYGIPLGLGMDSSFPTFSLILQEREITGP